MMILPILQLIVPLLQGHNNRKGHWVCKKVFLMNLAFLLIFKIFIEKLRVFESFFRFPHRSGHFLNMLQRNY